MNCSDNWPTIFGYRIVPLTAMLLFATTLSITFDNLDTLYPHPLIHPQWKRLQFYPMRNSPSEGSAPFYARKLKCYERQLCRSFFSTARSSNEKVDLVWVHSGKERLLIFLLTIPWRWASWQKEDIGDVTTPPSLKHFTVWSKISISGSRRGLGLPLWYDF